MPTLGTRGGGSVRGFGRFGGGRPSQITTIAATDVGSGRAYNNGRIDISWTAPSSNGAPITGYLIERSTNSGSTFSTLVANTGSATSTYSDTGLSSAQRYDYRVSAINATGTAIASSSVNATATTIPQAPTVGAASRAADNQVSLTFTANATGGSTITSYTIVSSPSISVSTNAGTTSPRTATASYGSGTSYTFTIAAVNANGTSAASAASGSVMPLQPAPSSVEYVVVAGGGTGSDGSLSGGGGAGGAMTGTYSVNSGSSYSISVAGAGGSSDFAGFSPIGGGSGSPGGVAGNGGSGGGTVSSNSNQRGRGTAGQGHDGGYNSQQQSASGGGGGYGSAGGNGRRAIDPNNGEPFNYTEPAQAGEGGGALSTSIEGGTNYYAYGGGGFGGGYYNIWSFNGDGGSGAANSGAGGGGAGGGTLSGGSGTVILAYNSNAKDATVSGGLSYNLNTNSRAGYKVYKFTGGSGNVSW